MTAHAEPRSRTRAEAASKKKLRLWLRLLRASRAIEAELRERMRRDFGGTLPRFDVMAALSRNERGMTMTELSRRLMVSNGNVTGIIDRLVAEGMVIRIRNEEDRRATFVRLTHEGAQRFEAMAAAHEVWINEILEHVGREETDTMIELLGNIAHRTREGVVRA
jgi:DNA-binding MarR family transcriptional regulator